MLKMKGQGENDGRLTVGTDGKCWGGETRHDTAPTAYCSLPTVNRQLPTGFLPEARWNAWQLAGLLARFGRSAFPVAQWRVAQTF